MSATSGRRLRNMVASGSRWLLITSNSGYANEELYMFRPGASRPLNLRAEPYNLPEPVWGDHYFALWTVEAVAARVAEKHRQIA